MQAVLTNTPLFVQKRTQRPGWLSIWGILRLFLGIVGTGIAGWFLYRLIFARRRNNNLLLPAPVPKVCNLTRCYHDSNLTLKKPAKPALATATPNSHRNHLVTPARSVKGVRFPLSALRGHKVSCSANGVGQAYHEWHF